MAVFSEVRMFLSRPRYVFDLEDRFARDRGLSGPHPRPFGSGRFFIVPENATVESLPKNIEGKFPELLMQRNPSGYFLFFDKTRETDGEVRQFLTGYKPIDKDNPELILPEGSFRIYVKSDFYQPVIIDMVLPEENLTVLETDFLSSANEEADTSAPQLATFSLLPAGNYPFAGERPTLLLGRVVSIDPEPLQDVTIQVDGEDISDTPDASGHWILQFPDDFFQEAKPVEGVNNEASKIIKQKEVTVNILVPDRYEQIPGVPKIVRKYQVADPFIAHLIPTDSPE